MLEIAATSVADPYTATRKRFIWVMDASKERVEPFPRYEITAHYQVMIYHEEEEMLMK